MTKNDHWKLIQIVETNSNSKSALETNFKWKLNPNTSSGKPFQMTIILAFSTTPHLHLNFKCSKFVFKFAFQNVLIFGC